MYKAATSKLFLTIAVFLATVPALSAQLHVISSGGFRPAYQELLPEFEKSTGIRVTSMAGASQGTGPNTIGAQLRGGLHADVVIMSKEGLRELIAEGRVAGGTDVDLAQVPIGMAVRAGVPKPDISTVEAFRQTVLHAKSIGIQSTTGIYLTGTLFPKLGIAEAMSGKITSGGAAAVASGETEIAVLPVSELLHVPGADFIGTIPKEIQSVSVFSAAMLAGSTEPAKAKQLIAFLASKQAAKAIANSGMEPMGSR